jgi:ERCC4-type nuclease
VGRQRGRQLIMSQAKIPEQTTVEPAVGQIYETKKTGESYQILYVDDQVVLLRSDNSGRNGNNTHRIERRVAFDNQVESSYFEYKPDSNLDMLSFAESDWTEVDYIGESTAENLHGAGFSTNLDIQKAEEEELMRVDGLGAKGYQNLIEFAR